jgi:hypothetical protein
VGADLRNLPQPPAGQSALTLVKQPNDGSELDVDTRTYNKLLRVLRCLGERRWRLVGGHG